tara:strand:- start:3263 stop:3607 length:345 start_codon:yes stop_codon:yes gene_type:complete
MSSHFHDESALLDERAKELFKLLPEQAKTMAQSRIVVYKDGALEGRMKELIALAIAMRCDGCVTHHAKLAAKKGLTREEVAEMVGVAMQMCGGPGMATGAEALAAFDEFSADKG